MQKPLSLRGKKESMTPTTFSDKLQILSELWLDYKEDEKLSDFIEYNDIGLPLAYVISNGIVESNDIAEKFIDQTFSMLLDLLEIEDSGFESLLDILPDNSN